MSFQDFDPAHILLNYTIDNTPVSVSFAALNLFQADSAKQGVIQGLGIGTGVILALVSWCSIANKKTPVFILNQVCLVLMVVRSILYIVYLMGPLNSLGFNFTNIYDTEWTAFRVSIAVTVVYVLLIAAIECLFVFQVYVMFKGCKTKLWKFGMVAFSSTLALAVVVIYVCEATFNLRDTWAGFHGIPRSPHWRINLPYILFCISVNFLSILLIGKLAMAIRTRKILGLKQFDALHVLLIMTLQTCIIPSAMAIYNYTSHERSPIFVNLSVIIIVCNLPFSSLWASSANTSSVPNSCLNSVFSRTSSRESEETLAFSFRSKANPKSEYVASTDIEKDSGEGSIAEDATINKILREIEMESRYQAR
ncbi:hypothetical protein PUMCH_003636 [Australozyma saopauloensis]|uniref:Pheromone alpha factor receptor n=1 Tax=Australozyma saopauloensis TaxID=291208 RepID=A0AAX4HDC7_9ASCO|nr:hypothetical protein PUMCH_003636 [[Candida] saopauloensis]